MLGSGAVERSGAKDYGNVRYLAQQLLDTVPQAGAIRLRRIIQH